MTLGALEQRVLAFTRDAQADDFGELALTLFEHQYLSFPLFRQRCEELGVTPTTVSDWREIPAVVASDPIARPSVDFQNALVRTALPELAALDRVGLVIDTESKAGAGAPSEAVFGALAGPSSEKSLVTRGRLTAGPLRSWLGARQRDRLAVQIISTTDGFKALTDLLDRRGLKFRLPPSSTAFCLTAVDRVGESAWQPSLGDHLGIFPEAYRRVICRVASTPLLESTEATEIPEAAGGFPLPHWVQVTGDPERMAVFDLASIAAPVHRIEPGVRASVDATRLTIA